MFEIHPTREAFRRTLLIPGTPQKVGQGDKQTDLYVLKDRDDPDGSRGSQSTCLSLEALNWTIDQRYRGHLQSGVNQGAIGYDAAQAIAAENGLGALHRPVRT
jgi:hypothetical protein